MFMFGYLEYLWVYPIGYLAFGSVGVFKPKRPVLNLLTHPVNITNSSKYLIKTLIEILIQV